MKDFNSSRKRILDEFSSNQTNPRRLVALGIGVIVLALAAGFVSVPYLYGTETDEPAIESIVGSDLTLQPDSLDYSESYHGDDRNPDRPVFPRVNRSSLSSTTPPQIQHIKPFNPDGSLEFLSHTVESGESLWTIARTYDRELYSIASANFDRLRRSRHLQVGTELRIPNRDGVLHEVERGESLGRLESTYGIPAEEIRKFNELERSTLQVGDELFIPDATPENPHKYNWILGGNRGFSWPVGPDHRRITSRFGNRYHPIHERVIFHNGVDFGASHGTPVHASERGRVIEAGRVGGYGLVVDIRHPNGYVTRYSHLSTITVSRGQTVNKRDMVGRVGQSGLATGPNLHFEILENGRKPVNPLSHLP